MMFIILILFFMYVFPLFFLAAPVMRTTPVFATVLLVVGVLLWSVQTYMITKFITLPKRMAKLHQRVQETGKPVQAEILACDLDKPIDGDPSKNLLIHFTNLAGNQVKAYINLVDTKVEKRRMEPGKVISIKLNKSGFEPAFTAATGEFDTKTFLWAWIWAIFNLLYMVGFFLVTYYLQSDGYGWRFLSPITSWLWAPIFGVWSLKFLLGWFGNQDLIKAFHRYQSFTSSKDFGELLLYGQTSYGEIINYAQTGTYINEQPEVRFDVQFLDGRGDLLTKSFKEIIPLTDLHQLKKGEAEVLYLPRDPDIFMVEPSPPASN